MINLFAKDLSGTPLYVQWYEEAKGLEIERLTGFRVVRVDDESEEADNFLEAELAIAAALGLVIADKANDVFDIVVNRLGRPVDTKFVDDALFEANDIMRDVYTRDVESLVSRELGLVARIGSASGTGSPNLLEGLPSLNEVLEGMNRSSRYYTNNYFNRIVMPALRTSIASSIASSDFVSSDSVFSAIRETLDSRLVSTPYWRLVANQASSRAYHYGVMKGGEIAGYSRYEIVTINDGKRSAICDEMDGRVFFVSDGVSYAERVAQADDTNIEQVAPWLTIDQVAGKTIAELTELGVMTPPFHANCRSSIRLIR